MTPEPRLVLDAGAVAVCLTRIAREISVQHPGPPAFALLGIQRGGVPIATELARLVSAASSAPTPHGSLDVSFHRDDAMVRLPSPATTHLPCDITGRTIILVDDVLFSGRTVRAAFDALHAYGRPARIRLAVLVDRGHRELPIAPDFVGASVPAEPAQKIRAGLDGVFLLDP